VTVSAFAGLEGLYAALAQNQDRAPDAGVELLIFLWHVSITHG
jgi:hypothetical protein